jgi:hypothetical protein
MNGLNGNEAAQPRVFAHDAIPLNLSASSGASYGFVKSLKITSDTGTPGWILNTLYTSSTNNVKIRVTALKADGRIGSIRIVNPGTGLVANDTLTFTGGSATAVLTVEALGLPATYQRGACLYVGNSGTNGIVCVIMESGDEVIFKGVTSGSFLPILATDVLRQSTDPVSGTAVSTDASDIIALY